MEQWQRLQLLRARAGYENATDAAKAFGWNRSTYISHENGTRGLRQDIAKRYAKAFHGKVEWLLFGEERPSKARLDKEQAVIRVPLIPLVSAGAMSDATLENVETIPLAGLPSGGDYLALRVIGDSMDRVSPNGSIVTVDRNRRDPINGRFYVFSLRREATYRIYRSGDPAYLEPFSTNPTHKPEFIKGKRGLVVVGRVLRTMLDL